MRTVVLCEGTTDLLMIQFVLQYKYGWKYDGFEENSETNMLISKQFKRDGDVAIIRSCRGMMNIPKEMLRIKDMTSFVTRREETIDKVIVLIDHDTADSNKEFLDHINENLNTKFAEDDINSYIEWNINNIVWKNVKIDLLIKCIPEDETGAIENILLEALDTDDIEHNLINDSRQFVMAVESKQKRYLQRKSLISKAVFNTYFAIRMPEEAPRERSKVLRTYDWKNNVVLNEGFRFLDI